jgi:hypothetical protein
VNGTIPCRLINNRLDAVIPRRALSVAFPHMTGDTQFDALLDHPKDMTILLDLGYLFQSIDEDKLDGALDKAVREGNSVAQFRILCFAEYSRTRLTARTKQMVVSLLASTEDHVRLSALALIQATADPVLLAGLVKSGWSATPLDAVANKVEMFHGSQALVLAAEQGSITLEACLDRIALSAYESLAERLGSEAAMAIADRPNTAIHKAAEFQITGNLRAPKAEPGSGRPLRTRSHKGRGAAYHPVCHCRAHWSDRQGGAHYCRFLADALPEAGQQEPQQCVQHRFGRSRSYLR